jgi:hypothetical protein
MGSGIRTCRVCKDFQPERGTRVGAGRCAIDGSLQFRHNRCPRNDPTPSRQETLGGAQ